MKINKDNVVGAIAMLLILAVVVWGWQVTVKVNKVALAHDNLVNVMSPIIQQLQQANVQRQVSPKPTGNAAPEQPAKSVSK